MSIKRQDIVDAIRTRLETVTTSGGYHTDLGNNVYVWRRAPFQDHELPAVNILDRETILQRESYKGSLALATYALKIEIMVIAAGEIPAEDIREMAADIYKAFGSDDTFGGLAIMTNPTGDEMYLEHEGEIVADAVLRFDIIYRTNRYQET